MLKGSVKAGVWEKLLNLAFIEQIARKTQRKYRKQLFNRAVVARHIQAERLPDFLCNTLCPPSLYHSSPFFPLSLSILLEAKLPHLKAHSCSKCLLSLIPILTVWVMSQPACPTLGNPGLGAPAPRVRDVI